MKVTALLLATLGLFSSANALTLGANNRMGEMVFMQTEEGAKLFASTGEKNCKRVKMGGKITAPAGARADTITDEYTVSECLGNGAFGEVWKAKSKADGKFYAVKVQTPAGGEEAGIIEEEKTSKKMNGIQGTIQMYEAGKCAFENKLGSMSNGRCMTLDLIGGGELMDFLVQYRGRGMPLKEALVMLKRMAETLNDVHTTVPNNLNKLGIVHSDLKPENVLLKMPSACPDAKPSPGNAETDECRPKPYIADFGVSAPVNARGHGGTPGLMAPEALKTFQPSAFPYHELRVTGKTDIYSLGMTFLSMMAGPFSANDAIDAHCDGDRHLFSDGCVKPSLWREGAVAGLPAPAKQLFAQMTAYLPRDRPSAAELVELVDAQLEKLGGPAVAAMTLLRGAAPPAPVAAEIPQAKPADPAAAAAANREGEIKRIAERSIFQEPELQPGYRPAAPPAHRAPQAAPAYGVGNVNAALAVARAGNARPNRAAPFGQFAPVVKQPAPPEAADVYAPPARNQVAAPVVKQLQAIPVVAAPVAPAAAAAKPGLQGAELFEVRKTIADLKVQIAQKEKRLGDIDGIARFAVEKVRLIREVKAHKMELERLEALF